MATPKRPDKYNKWFRKLFELGASGSAEIPCGSQEEAVNKRSQYYAFRTALYTYPEYFPSLTEVAPHVKFRIKPPGVTFNTWRLEIYYAG